MRTEFLRVLAACLRLLTDAKPDFAKNSLPARRMAVFCARDMCFSVAASSENEHGSMNLASKTAPPRRGKSVGTAKMRSEISRIGFYTNSFLCGNW